MTESFAFQAVVTLICLALVVNGIFAAVEMVANPPKTCAEARAECARTVGFVCQRSLCEVPNGR